MCLDMNPFQLVFGFETYFKGHRKPQQSSSEGHAEQLLDKHGFGVPPSESDGNRKKAECGSSFCCVILSDLALLEIKLRVVQLSRVLVIEEQQTSNIQDMILHQCKRSQSTPLQHSSGVMWQGQGRRTRRGEFQHTNMLMVIFIMHNVHHTDPFSLVF